jgi:chitin biosynthesis protein CHS5
VLRCRNATQTSVVLEWDPIQLATADLISLSLYRNGQKAGNIPRPLQMHSTKISGLAVDTEYTFHLVLRTSAGTFISERVPVRTHKMTDLRGITITTGILPSAIKDNLTSAVERIGAKIVDGVRIDTTHFVTTEGRGQQWEKAVESNIPVVRPEWVEACEKSGRILGVTKFYLDAMKPGPPAEEASPPPPPEKEEKSLPVPPAHNGEQASQSEEKLDEKVKEKEDADAQKNGGKQSSSGSSTEDEEEEEVEVEQKTKTLPQEEQKVRFEDKEEQKVALRPAHNGESSKPEQDDKQDASDDEAEDESNAKTAPTPDGASFQEVEL